MNIHSVYAPFLRHFRKKRIRLLYDILEITKETSVVDVGGGFEFWRLVRQEGYKLPRLTIVNIYAPRGVPEESVQWIVADGRALPFSDEAFDVALSNSVIEHVGDADSQRRFAREVQRVATKYFVQTPNRRYPIEPHLITPFIHWAPKKWQYRLIRNFTIWGILTRPSIAYSNQFLNETRLLSWKDMRSLFPDSQLLAERTFGWTKSLVAMRGRR